MSESRTDERVPRRRGRGIDAIFETSDLDLGRTVPEPEADLPSPEDVSAEPRGATRRRGASPPRERRSAPKRGPGRPTGSGRRDRELLQRGFYLEPDQDRMVDEIKVALKSLSFTPDRSAIVRAAIENFYELDPAEQEEQVRRAK